MLLMGISIDVELFNILWWLKYIFNVDIDWSKMAITTAVDR